MKVCVLAAIVFALGLAGQIEASAASARIKKVLPHLLDRQGRHSSSPSLFERDAYQAQLRKQPAQQSGLRFDIQWRASDASPLLLRIEMRGTKEGKSTTHTLTATVSDRSLFSQWSEVTLTGEDFRCFGELAAWRATLWADDRMVAEQKSFLW